MKRPSPPRGMVPFDPWLTLVLAAGLLGCPGRPSPERTAPPARRAVVPTSVVAHSLTLEWPAEVPRAKLPPLPAFPRFEDPYPLPKRTLKRERRLGFTAKGRARLFVHTHLAARLWALANRNLQRIRLLESQARRRGRPAPQTRIAQLRQEASAHLRECVTLLDGVLEVKAAPVMARVRLAHYLRELKPTAAIPHFRILVRETKAPATRQRYALDLAQLLLLAGRPADADSVLRRNAAKARSPRARLLAALARARAGVAPDRQGVIALMDGCDGLAPGLRTSLLESLPELLVGCSAPEQVLSRWARRAPRCWAKHGSGVAHRAAVLFLENGRPSRAAQLLRAAVAQGAAIPASVRGRMQRMGGPWPTRPAPPAAADWKRLVQRRLLPLLRCFPKAANRAVSITLRLLPDGTARPRGASSKQPCVRRVVGEWRFPGWRAARAVELRLRIPRAAAP